MSILAGGASALPDLEREFGLDVVNDYLGDLVTAVQGVDRQAVRDAAVTVGLALRDGRRVFLAGNGGSSAAASHIASDWDAATAGFVPAPLIQCLSDNTVRLTATANDKSYDEVFAHPISVKGTEGDVTVLLSVSGSSRNIVLAAQAAQRRGVVVVGLFGRAGHATRYVDHLVVSGGGDYGVSEDLQCWFGHLVVRYLYQ